MEKFTNVDIIALVNSTIPQPTNEDRFWAAAANTVFQGVLANAVVSGDTTNKAIWKTLTLPLDELEAVLAQTPGAEKARSYLEDKKLAANVVSVILAHTAFIHATPEMCPFLVLSEKPAGEDPV